MSSIELLFWRAVDWLDYWFWNVRLRIVDAVYGSEPEPKSDRQRSSAE